MLLESETDLRLILAAAAAAALILALLGYFLLARASAALRRANDALARTEIGADRTERRMFNILQAIPVALVETDTSGKFTFANRAAHQLLGRKDAELLGLRFHSATWGITYPDGRLIPPDLLPAARALRGQTVKGFQHVIVNPNSRKKMLVSVTAMPILDDKGEVIGSSSAIVEIEGLAHPHPELEDELKPRYFDIAGVMLIGLDREGKVRDINQAGADILGLAPEEIIGRDWIADFLPEEQRADARASFKALVAGKAEAPERSDGWIVRPDGERRLVAWRTSVLRDDRGKVIATLNSGEDVTERRAAQASARRNEETLKLAQEAGGVAVWTMNPKTGELSAGPALTRLLGLDEDVTPDLERYRAMVHADDLARVEAEFTAAWKGETKGYRTEYRIVRPDGEVRWLHLRGERVDAGEDQPKLLRGVGYDVTDLKAAQAAARESEARAGESAEALAASEARFRGFADAIDEVLWIFDVRAGRLDYVNEAYDRVWGEAREALLDDPERWRTLVVPEDAALVEEGQRQLAQGQPRDIEFRIRRPDGEERILHDSAFVMRDDKGNPLWIAGVARDVTEARRAEASLKASAEELEQRVAERTAALEAATEERSRTEAALAQAQRLETVGRLTGGVAHDFNNLLTVVIGALDMMLRQADRPERVRKLGEAALTASKRGERLTRQLLAFSRRQEFKLETLELAPVIKGFESLMRRAAEESTPLKLEVQSGVGAVRVDAVQLEAALLNLVVNAKDAVEQGGEITVKVDRVQLHQGRIPDTPAGDYVRISVVDTGMGMEPDVAARALEPFFTTKDVGKGAGLGLAQVYGFARQSGGGVEIESALGQGTAVSIYLPVADMETEASETPHKINGAALAPGARILLVEDDLGVRAVAENLLTELGCEVVTADDGPSALETLDRTPGLDLLLTDIVMPGGMSGVELAEEARTRRPELKVLLATGYAGELLNGEADHGWPVLRKPYHSEQLSEAVRRALQ